MDARLRELAREFTRLGLTAFGGPAAHVAIMQRELVERRGWLTPQRFVELIGLSSLLPGPSSTEVALGIGFERAGWRGLIIAALGFIGPAALMMLVLAVLYVEVGSLGDARYLLYGMAPVVVAVIAHAMVKLVPAAFTDTLTWVVGTAAFLVALFTFQPLIALIAGVFVVMLVRRAPIWFARQGPLSGLGMLPLAGPALPSGGLLQSGGSLLQSGGSLLQPGSSLLPSGGPATQVAAAVTTMSVASLGLVAIFGTFLKIGLVVFGSGYVLIAFLGTELVEPGYITQQQLLDAVALGQLTPGPVFTTATFIGYLMAGVPGAIAATVGIFLPAVLLVGLIHPWLDRIRANATLAAAIAGLNAAAIGLIGFSIVLLAQEAFLPFGTIDPITVALSIGSLMLLGSGRVGPVPLLLAGAVIGFAWRVLSG